MNLLATDRCVAFDRDYPFEIQYLSYYAKLASILENRMPDDRFTSEHLYRFEDSTFGPWPWLGHNGGKGIDWFRIFWILFSSQVKRTNPTATFYAEKAPVWLPCIVRRVVPCFTVYLFRDPRDVYLSSNAFMKKRNYYGFHRSPADTDLDHARNLGVELLNYFENFNWEKQRQDCVRMRYEDLIVHSEGLLAWLRGKGLSPDLDHAFEYIDAHRTSPDPVSSVERWRREGIPHQVSDFFERHAGSEMEALGYSVESASFCPSVEFQSGAPAPQVIDPAHGRLELNEDAMIIQVIGNDFGILLPFTPVRAEEVHEIWVSAAGCVGDHFSVYWRDPDVDFSEDRTIHVKYLPSEHWRVVRFRMWQHPLWRGTIQQIRLDLFNAQVEDNQGSGYVRWVRLVR
jgi:hypothetical protein